MLLPIGHALLVMALQAAQPAPTSTPGFGLPLTGAEAEEFLRTAEVVEVGDITSRGVTRPRVVVLSDGDRTLKAVYKTIDEYERLKVLPDGRWSDFRDSYKHEVAAYELDKVLELHMVPPCVTRRAGREQGALCMWVEGVMSEADRIKRKIQPPDPVAWNHQAHTIQLFLQLVGDQDYKNISNILIDPDFNVYKIDSSRAFRNDKKVLDKELLKSFSRSFLKKLSQLDMETLNEALGQSLMKSQIKAILARRDHILQIAEAMVAEKGEAVLYP